MDKFKGKRPRKAARHGSKLAAGQAASQATSRQRDRQRTGTKNEHFDPVCVSCPKKHKQGIKEPPIIPPGDERRRSALNNFY